MPLNIYFKTLRKMMIIIYSKPKKYGSEVGSIKTV